MNPTIPETDSTHHRSLYDRLGGHAGIRNLLEPFYADVRQHQVIGPIFLARIHDWDQHLAKITEFWALQAGGTSRYNGGFGAAHIPLQLEPQHFRHWLSLWEFNAYRQLPRTEAAEMVEIAQLLGQRLLRVTQMAPRRP